MKQFWVLKNSAAVAEFNTHNISRLLALGILCSSFRFSGRTVSNERKQVLAHGEFFVGTPWYSKVKPHQWCEAAGIPSEIFPSYLDAIAANLAGTNPCAFTLSAVKKSTDAIPLRPEGATNHGSVRGYEEESLQLLRPIISVARQSL